MRAAKAAHRTASTPPPLAARPSSATSAVRFDSDSLAMSGLSHSASLGSPSKARPPRPSSAQRALFPPASPTRARPSSPGSPSSPASPALAHRKAQRKGATTPQVSAQRRPSTAGPAMSRRRSSTASRPGSAGGNKRNLPYGLGPPAGVDPVAVTSGGPVELPELDMVLDDVLTVSDALQALRGSASRIDTTVGALSDGRRAVQRGLLPVDLATPGPDASDRVVAALQRENDRMRADCATQQSLLQHQAREIRSLEAQLTTLGSVHDDLTSEYTALELHAKALEADLDEALRRVEDLEDPHRRSRRGSNPFNFPAEASLSHPPAGLDTTLGLDDASTASLSAAGNSPIQRFASAVSAIKPLPISPSHRRVSRRPSLASPSVLTPSHLTRGGSLLGSAKARGSITGVRLGRRSTATAVNLAGTGSSSTAAQQLAGTVSFIGGSGDGGSDKGGVVHGPLWPEALWRRQRCVTLPSVGDAAEGIFSEASTEDLLHLSLTEGDAAASVAKARGIARSAVIESGLTLAAVRLEHVLDTLDPDAMVRAVLQADAVLRAEVARHDGHLASAGSDDRYHAVFADVASGVNFAMDLHAALLAVEWPAFLEDYTETARAFDTVTAGLMWGGIRAAVALHVSDDIAWERCCVTDAVCLHGAGVVAAETMLAVAPFGANVVGPALRARLPSIAAYIDDPLEAFFRWSFAAALRPAPDPDDFLASSGATSDHGSSAATTQRRGSDDVAVVDPVPLHFLIPRALAGRIDAFEALRPRTAKAVPLYRAAMPQYSPAHPADPELPFDTAVLSSPAPGLPDGNVCLVLFRLPAIAELAAALEECEGSTAASVMKPFFKALSDARPGDVTEVHVGHDRALFASPSPASALRFAMTVVEHCNTATWYGPGEAAPYVAPRQRWGRDVGNGPPVVAALHFSHTSPRRSAHRGTAFYVGPEVHVVRGLAHAVDYSCVAMTDVMYGVLTEHADDPTLRCCHEPCRTVLVSPRLRHVGAMPVLTAVPPSLVTATVERMVDEAAAHVVKVAGDIAAVRPFKRQLVARAWHFLASWRANSVAKYHGACPWRLALSTAVGSPLVQDVIAAAHFQLDTFGRVPSAQLLVSLHSVRRAAGGVVDPSLGAAAEAAEAALMAMHDDAPLLPEPGARTDRLLCPPFPAAATAVPLTGPVISAMSTTDAQREEAENKAAAEAGGDATGGVGRRATAGGALSVIPALDAERKFLEARVAKLTAEVQRTHGFFTAFSKLCGDFLAPLVDPGAEVLPDDEFVVKAVGLAAVEARRPKTRLDRQPSIAPAAAEPAPKPTTAKLRVQWKALLDSAVDLTSGGDGRQTYDGFTMCRSLIGHCGKHFLSLRRLHDRLVRILGALGSNDARATSLRRASLTLKKLSHPPAAVAAAEEERRSRRSSQDPHGASGTRPQLATAPATFSAFEEPRPT